MAKILVAEGVTYHKFSMEEFESEILFMTSGNVPHAERLLRKLNVALLSASAEHRQLAQHQLAAACRGRCHGISNMGNKVPLPAAEQRRLGHIVLTGAALSIGSGGLGILISSGRAIQFSVAAQSAVRTTTTAAQSAAQTTWIVTSDMATKAIVATSPVSLNPVLQQSIIDFSTSLFPGSPAMSGAGAAGGFMGAITNPQELLR